MAEENQVITDVNKNNNFKNIILSYKKTLIFIFIITLILLFSYFFYIDYKKNINVKISEQYNSAIISYNSEEPNKTVLEMKNIIDARNSTYSPLALYFLLDNNLLKEKNEINKYFDDLIYKVDLDEEIKNLIIYKKGLFNSGNVNENELLEIFKPILNNDNMWKSHALYVLGEYFYAKNEKQKSKEFFEKILELKNSNPQIKLEAQKRLNRDFSV
tara:strand:+ start:217 stop:861 length:645 start_codon:yes stop_codon:yes gene_type:complete